MSSFLKEIYCCECKKDVVAALLTGKEIYHYRRDLWGLPFWQCPRCKNHVGCHYKTDDNTRPLGCIANEEIKKARQHLHTLIDPVCKSGQIARHRLYALISEALGYEYHAGEIRSIEEARKIYRIAKWLIDKECKQDPLQ